MKSEKDYYVYGLIDPNNNEMFYIGKGKGNRAFQHLYGTTKSSFLFDGKNSRIERIQERGTQPEIFFFQKDLSEDAAFMLEMVLIDRIGRSSENYGPLENILVGGKHQRFFKFDLLDSERPNMDFLQKNFPEIISTIESVPYSSREQEIKSEEKRLRIIATGIFEKYDKGLLSELGAINPRFYFDPNNEDFLKFIFSSKIGDILIRFEHDSPTFNESYTGNSSYRLIQPISRGISRSNISQKEVVLDIRKYLSEKTLHNSK